MKTRLLAIIGFVLLVFSFFPQVIGEPISREEFMKTYQPILDLVNDQKLSPYRQIDVGILMRDVMCFNDGVKVLKLSSQSYIACVKPDTATILVQRGWGDAMYDETKNPNNHASECSITWNVNYLDTPPEYPELIYKLRHTLNSIQEYLIWYPVTVEDDNRFTVTMHSVGLYSASETELIINSLKSVPRVESVEAIPGGCI